MISSRIGLSTVRNANASSSDANGARPLDSPGSYVDNFALEQAIIDIKSRCAAARDPASQLGPTDPHRRILPAGHPL